MLEYLNFQVRSKYLANLIILINIQAYLSARLLDEAQDFWHSFPSSPSRSSRISSVCHVPSTIPAATYLGSDNKIPRYSGKLSLNLAILTLLTSFANNKIIGNIIFRHYSGCYLPEK
jgi:hypothetical protein